MKNKYLFKLINNYYNYKYIFYISLILIFYNYINQNLLLIFINLLSFLFY